MGQDTDEILVAAGGIVAVAPVGTALPTTPTQALNVAFVDLGLITEDGVTFTDAKTMEVIKAWQLFYPARRIITERDADAKMTLLQWSRETIPFAFGGGAVQSVSGASGVFSYQPPDPGAIDERSMVIGWTDGTKHYRLVIPRGTVTDNIDTQLAKMKAGELPLTFGIIGQDGIVPWEFLTDDPSFAP